ncbi:MAG: hypothetical protein H6741_01385 [Alphaproteobacteria bacterium]|nr:hypothetical protein [Alphaproteobacteria bacterium]
MLSLFLALACSGPGKQAAADSGDTAAADSGDSADSASTDSGDSGPGEDSAPGEDSGPFDQDGDGHVAAEDCDDLDAERWDQVGSPFVSWVGLTNVYTVCDAVCERPVRGAIELDDATQSQLNALDCVTEVGVWVDIRCRPDAVQSLGLDQLQRADLGFSLICDGPEALGGLGALARVSDFTLSGEAFTDLSELGALREVSGDLHLVGLESLEDLSDFAGLEVLGGTLRLQSLPRVRSLAGLEGVLAAPAEVSLEDLDAFDDLALLAGASALERLTLDSLPALRDLSPVPDQALDTLVLQDLGVSTLAGLAGVSPRALRLVNLDALTGLEGPELGALRELYVYDADALVELGDLSGVQALDELRLSNNPALVSLDGLSGLQAVQGRLEIARNDQLRDLSGLHGLITPGTQLYIHDNPCLPQAEVDALIEAIGEEALPEDRLLERNEGPC